MPFHENTRGFTLTEVGPEARKLLRQHLLTGPWKNMLLHMGSPSSFLYTPEDQRLEPKNPAQLKKKIIFSKIIIFRFPVHLPGWSTWSDHDDSSNFAGQFSEWWFARLDSEEDAKREWVFCLSHHGGHVTYFRCFNVSATLEMFLLNKNAQSQCWWIHLGRPLWVYSSESTLVVLKRGLKQQSHRIHVWHIFLHLGDFLW